MKNIVLTGFMGTGKTEVGRELSSILGWKLIDVDEEIVKSRRMTINEIFGTLGEPAFREIETEMIKKLSESERVIISTGGGAVLRKENIDLLRKKGVIVNLSATAETIFERTKSDDARPLLRVEDPMEKICELLRLRQPYYENADIVIDTESKPPRGIAEEILERIGWKR